MSNTFVVAAYIIAWLALCIYVAIFTMRLRGVRTELAAVEELVREHQQNELMAENEGKVKS